MVKNPPANAGNAGSVPGSGKSPEKEMATHYSILAGKSRGQSCLAGYSSGGRRRVRHDLGTKQQTLHSELFRNT